MFTIKAFRKDATGKEKIYVSEAVSYCVQRDADGLKDGEAFVILLDPYGERPAITVSHQAPEKDQWICHMVCIENSSGKTTDVIRAKKPPDR